jgi:hypothetical protein
MRNYPKINTIFPRDDKGNIKREKYCAPEFESINRWTFTEKIDGMNIVVRFHLGGSFGFEDKWCITFGGKTDNAQIPVKLLDYLKKTFLDNQNKFIEYFLIHDKSVKDIIIHGEGYGEGIQKGGDYSKEQRFVAFDMEIDNWWLEQDHSRSICSELGIDFVPKIELNSIPEAIDFIENKKPLSHLAEKERPMEGIVATSYPLMLFRNGEPIKWKLKQKDFKNAKPNNSNKFDISK